MLENFFAYIDPGSGSYLFQLLIAGLTTIVFFFATLKRKIFGLFRSSGESKTPTAASGTEAVPDKQKSETQAISQ